MAGARFGSGEGVVGEGFGWVGVYQERIFQNCGYINRSRSWRVGGRGRGVMGVRLGVGERVEGAFFMEDVLYRGGGGGG